MKAARTDEERLVVAELDRQRAPWRAAHYGYRYDGPAGFVLEHGAWHDRRLYPFRDGLRQGAPKQCFGNAIALAIRDGFAYVEGYALDPLGEVVLHGWNLDPDGRLVDSTWLNTGHAYLGVPFSIERADDATWNGDATVLDDHHRGWPLLRERWAGEPDTPAEYAGGAERLEILRRRDLPAWDAYLAAHGVTASVGDGLLEAAVRTPRIS